MTSRRLAGRPARRRPRAWSRSARSTATRVPPTSGVANLVAFIATAGRFWPFVLISGGVLMLVAGLRPRRPLPPEPDPYRAGEAPLAARVDDRDR